MNDWNEEMSPILLIIRDCTKNVFGAIVSTVIRPSEHFFGTGDSCLLFRFVTDPESGEKYVYFILLVKQIFHKLNFKRFKNSNVYDNLLILILSFRC